jgi:hypothetical protein
MLSINEIIKEEILNTVANYPEFGERLHNLDEYGEGTFPAYPFKFQNISFNEVEYDFDTEDGDEYIVIIKQIDRVQNIWDIQFGIAGGEPTDVLNKGRRDYVMSTIVKITNDFIDRFKPNALTFKPEKSKGENDMRRFNMYMAYIRKNMRDDYMVFERKPHIIIQRKAPIINKNTVTV